MKDLLTKFYMDKLINEENDIKRGIRAWVIGGLIPMPLILSIVNRPLVVFLTIIIAHCVLISIFLIYQLFYGSGI